MHFVSPCYSGVLKHLACADWLHTMPLGGRFGPFLHDGAGAATVEPAEPFDRNAAFASRKVFLASISPPLPKEHQLSWQDPTFAGRVGGMSSAHPQTTGPCKQCFVEETRTGHSHYSFAHLWKKMRQPLHSSQQHCPMTKSEGKRNNWKVDLRRQNTITWYHSHTSTLRRSHRILPYHKLSRHCLYLSVHTQRQQHGAYSPDLTAGSESRTLQLLNHQHFSCKTSVFPELVWPPQFLACKPRRDSNKGDNGNRRTWHYLHVRCKESQEHFAEAAA